MKLHLVALVLSLLVCCSTTSAAVFFVKSANGSCPADEPCQTLDQYAQSSSAYFTTGSTFVFLSGNHSLQSTLILTEVSRITLMRWENDLSDANIICKGDVTIYCKAVKKFKIQGLTFLLGLNNSSNQNSSCMVLEESSVIITYAMFLGSGQLKKLTYYQQALITRESSVVIEDCLFKGSTGNYGGAIYTENAVTNLSRNIFIENRATYGGAVYILGGLLNIYQRNSFVQNSAVNGGAIYTYALSLLNIYLGNSFVQNSAVNGGAIYAYALSLLNIYLGNSFVQNSAVNGGAIYTNALSLLNIYLGNSFVQNSAVNGGAIYTHARSLLNITGNNQLKNFFRNNHAERDGGAISVISSDFSLVGNVLLENNRGQHGGGIFLLDSKAILQGNVTLQENSAETGGGIFIKTTVIYDTCPIIRKHHSSMIILTGTYLNNTAVNCGGAVFVEATFNITNFHNVKVQGNSGSALCFFDANNVTFSGTTDISNNTGLKGGGIYSWKSYLTFEGPSSFQGNEASESSGGALYAIYGSTIVFKFNFNITHQFSHNTAKLNGGAIYAINTNIRTIVITSIFSYLIFSFNSAQNGGAMYFGNLVTLNVQMNTEVHSTNNSATEYGGSIYYDDSATSVQCTFPANGSREEIELLPSCFLQLEVEYPRNMPSFFISRGDYAYKGGSILYGGLLDRSTMEVTGQSLVDSIFVPYELVLNRFFSVQDNKARSITSEPYQLCFCTDDQTCDCSELKSIRVHRGQTFNLSILALDQIKNIIPTLVTAQVGETATLRLNQNLQSSTEHCTNLTFNFYSTSDKEQLILYPLNGPCRDTGLARAIVNVTILPCPDAFTQLDEKCTCEERLQKYSITCSIEETAYITREIGSRFWMGALYSLDACYAGLILYGTCPFDYCKQDIINFTLESLDKQCNVNRGKVLCGACVNNSSLMLGGFQCGVCSNRYLTLLVLFAVVGIVLVIFLSVLRLTVATGMINGVILYANIVQVNRTIFFPDNPHTVLTVFVAWLNLDLGFQTCFYNGMTAYAQTWLQFAFPLYVWILISFIILSSRYSITVSKLIGHNPIAVLATLLLMSYTKALKIIIEVYSSVVLDYPDNKTVRVWLKDANVPYLKSWHLLLTVVTTLILVFLFIPYTLLLLTGYKLYRYSAKKCLHWLNKVKPLLDSYYASHESHARYWTGLLLLVRCGLYIVFSFNSLRGTSKSLVIINILLVVMIMALLSIRIYSSFLLNIMEALIYLNLVVLSATTLAGVSSPPLVHTMVGVVFVTMMCIIVYHFHLTYTAKSAVWLKIKGKVTEKVKKTSDKQEESVPVAAPTVKVIDLREPLLDVD